MGFPDMRFTTTIPKCRVNRSFPVALPENIKGSDGDLDCSTRPRTHQEVFFECAIYSMYVNARYMEKVLEEGIAKY